MVCNDLRDLIVFLETNGNGDETMCVTNVTHLTGALSGNIEALVYRSDDIEPVILTYDIVDLQLYYINQRLEALR